MVIGTPCSGPQRRAGRPGGVGGVGAGPRRIPHLVDDGVERRVQPVDPLKEMLQALRAP